jgi:hypothetical protein
VALVFPVLNCTTTGPCGNSSVNDITGLTVSQLTLKLSGSTSEPQPGDYGITGNGITLDGLTIATGTLPSTEGGQFGDIELPITLGGSQTWSIGLKSGSNFNLAGVTGTGNLTVSLPGNASGGGGFLGLPSAVDVGTLTFKGSSAAGVGNSIVAPGSSLNSNGNPVNLTDTGLFTASAGSTTYGPLTVTGSHVQFGNGGGNGPYGLQVVDGSAKFDSTSSIDLEGLEPGTTAKPVAGTDYPQLSASGSVSLRSVGLSITAGCGQKVGTVYTIVTAAGGRTGTFSGIANGAVVQANADQQPSCSVAGAVAPYLKYKYKVTSVTATVVAAPASTKRASTDRNPESTFVWKSGRVVQIKI